MQNTRGQETRTFDRLIGFVGWSRLSVRDRFFPKSYFPLLLRGNTRAHARAHARASRTFITRVSLLTERKYEAKYRDERSRAAFA